jgi:hypothetical protein
MPNWCYTSYRIVGKEEEVRDLYKKMDELENMKKSLIRNDFGTSWMGNLVHELGADWKKVNCRGWWDGLEIQGAELRFYVESAWSPLVEVHALIKKTYPSLKIYYSAEEEGTELYETNDAEGRFFPDRYILRTEYKEKSYRTFEKLLGAVSKYVGHGVKSKGELDDIIDEGTFEDLDYYEYEIVKGEEDGND